VGAAGGAEGTDHAALARRKFLRCGGQPEAAELVQDLERLPPEDVGRLLELALGMPGDTGAAT
jgi:hypothetical protein